MKLAKKTLFHGAAAGTCAAALWAAQEPLDTKVFTVSYSDPELLGRVFSQKSLNRQIIGYGWHVTNGMLFGCLYSTTKKFFPKQCSGWQTGLIAGLAEHLATWPSTKFVSKLHPNPQAFPQLYGNRKAFLQATWRHALFGVALGIIEEKLSKKTDALNNATGTGKN